MGYGGKRTGAGRKPKTEEIELIELLSPLDPIAFTQLEKGVKKGDFNFIKLFFEYRHGKPKQTIDATLKGDLNVIWNEQKIYETK